MLFSERQLRDDLTTAEVLQIFGPEYLPAVLAEGLRIFPCRIDPAEIPFYMRGFEVETVTASACGECARQVMALRPRGKQRPGGILRRYIVTEALARVAADGSAAQEIRVGYFNSPFTAGDAGGDPGYSPHKIY